MPSQTFNIPNISCGHCVNSIKSELSELEGVTRVDGDPQSKNIVVEFDSPTTTDRIKAKLAEINYPAQS